MYVVTYTAGRLRRRTDSAMTNAKFGIAVARYAHREAWKEVKKIFSQRIGGQTGFKKFGAVVEFPESDKNIPSLSVISDRTQLDYVVEPNYRSALSRRSGSASSYFVT